MMTSMELYRSADRLEWTAWTAFTGDKSDGDGNMDGQLCAITGNKVVASAPLSIFTTAAWDNTQNDDAADEWPLEQDNGALGHIIADPRTEQQLHDQIRHWCRHELGRNDVALAL